MASWNDIATQEVTLGEPAVGARAEVRVGDGTEQHLVPEGDIRTLLGEQRQSRSDVAARRVACHGQSFWVDAVLTSATA